MSDIDLKRLRRLRDEAESLLKSLSRDLEPFKHDVPDHGFRRTPESDSVEGDVNVTTTCSCLMALALTNRLYGFFEESRKQTNNATQIQKGKENEATRIQKSKDEVRAIFSRLLASPWMSSGLPEDNAFTTTLIIRLTGFLTEAGVLNEGAANSTARPWEPRIKFNLGNLASKLTSGATPFAGFLHDLLPKDLQQGLKSVAGQASSGTCKKVAKKLRSELIRLIGASSFYNKEYFKDVDLSAESRSGLKERPYGYSIAKLNRNLIHEAFPNDIAPRTPKSLSEIAAIISGEPDNFKINDYPPAAAVVYWFVDGVSRAQISLDFKNWEKLCAFATEEFGRQRSRVVARHATMMDPVSMAMAAALCARLRRICKEQELGAAEEHENSLPSTVELESAAVDLFKENGVGGIWAKYFPLFHYQDAGSNFCFSFELLEAVLKEFGGSRGRLLQEEQVVTWLEQAVQWCRANRLKCSRDGAATYEGWNSGGNLITLQKGQPESWATAVVHMFLWELVEVLSGYIQEALLKTYNASEIGPTKKLDNLLDINLWLDERPTSLVETIRETIVDTFKEFRAAKAGKLRSERPLKNRPISALLFGPPGTSKTQIAQAIAAELQWPLVEIDPSRFLHHGFQSIYSQGDQIFGDVMDMSGVVVLFDEMDALVLKRDKETAVGIESRFLTTYMLPKLAKLHDRGRVVFLMATNFPEDFDDAIKRAGRFDLLLCMGPPSLDAKIQKLAKFFPDGEDDAKIESAAQNLRSMTDNDPWAGDQLELMTYGDFESFIPSIGDAGALARIPKRAFVAHLKKAAKSYLLKRDDLKGVRLPSGWKKISDLDRKNFTRSSLKLKQHQELTPVLKYLLERKQSRRQYPKPPQSAPQVKGSK